LTLAACGPSLGLSFALKALDVFQFGPWAMDSELPFIPDLLGFKNDVRRDHIFRIVSVYDIAYP
jgi:hypothetical protein